jgi:hypothetical protein
VADDAALEAQVDELRKRGEVVVRALEENEPYPEGVERELRLVNGRWQVVAIGQK